MKIINKIHKMIHEMRININQEWTMKIQYKDRNINKIGVK